MLTQFRGLNRLHRLLPLPSSSPAFRFFASSTHGHDPNNHNPMNPELYTENAYLSITRLPQYADRYKTQYIEATHILKSIIDEGPNGLAQRAIAKAGVNTTSLNE